MSLLALIPMLALTDGWTIALAIGQVTYNVLLTAALGWIASRSKRIEQLEEELKLTATNLIDQRIESSVSGLQRSLDQMAQQIASINQRLSAGESEFRGLDRQDSKLEIKIAAAFSEIKDIMRRECAGRDEQAQIAAQLKRLEIEVARMHHGDRS